LNKPFTDVVFREAERGDGSPRIFFRLPLQFFRRMGEKTKEDRSAHCDNDAAHLASSLIEV
jgi:hypothetical protein